MGVALGWVGEKPKGQVDTSMGIGVPWGGGGMRGGGRGEKITRRHEVRVCVCVVGGGGGAVAGKY